MAYDGPREVHGVGYSPTWPNFSPSPGGSQFEDSDFYNSAFSGLWSTPRDVLDNGSKVTDLQAINQTGFNLIRLYDWNPQRGFNSPTSGASTHVAFLNAAKAAGEKVLVPISNYQLGNVAWSGGIAPIPVTLFGFRPTGCPAATAVLHQERHSRNSQLARGPIHPAVFGFEVGNEVDLNAGAFAGGNISAITSCARCGTS